MIFVHQVQAWLLAKSRLLFSGQRGNFKYILELRSLTAEKMKGLKKPGIIRLRGYVHMESGKIIAPKGNIT